MKVLSYMAQLFLPFSVVCSVYGTPFIMDVTQSDSPISLSSLAIRPQIWQLWAVSVPTTMVVMAFIYTYTNWYHVKKICSRGRESDLESAGNRPGLTLENP
jgi:Mg2+ and Co2+ transporter CorA